MPNAVEHAEVVLAAIIPNRSDLLEKAMARLSESHFVDDSHRKMFTFLIRYYQNTATVLPEFYLDDQLRNADPGKRLMYMETYRAFAAREVDDSAFSWSVEQLRELTAERKTITALTEAMAIAKTGKLLSNGETLKGSEDAREFLSGELSAIDKDLKMQAAPEGDIRDEGDKILDEYAERKQAHKEGKTGGINFGIPELDGKIGGMQPGELILIAGYSSDGKSSLAVQAAWNACVMQGKNVLFLTTETLRPQINRKLIARHSKHPMFGLPEGLNTRDLKAGTLPEELEESFTQVVGDFTSNTAYGKMFVAQVPRGSTISSIEQTMYRVQKSFNIDIVVMDYLALLKSDSRKTTTREELAAIMKEAKQVATTFDDGRGVAFVSPWQVSRLARENAEKAGMYTSASLSETAEATNSADVIVSLLAPSDNTDRRCEVAMQVLKNRDGETANHIVVEVDYATCHFRGRESNGRSPMTGFGGLDGYL